MQKHVNLVDLVKSFPTKIYLQNLASIQKRTSPVKFAHLAEKSGKGSISNLSTKVRKAAPTTPRHKPATARRTPPDKPGRERTVSSLRTGTARARSTLRRTATAAPCAASLAKLANYKQLHFCKFLQIFGGLVLGCIKTKFCKKICVRQHFSSSTRFAPFCTAAI